MWRGTVEVECSADLREADGKKCKQNSGHANNDVRCGESDKRN